jgi:hypothetical protein
MKLVPIRPFSPGVMIFSWSVFILILLVVLMMGRDASMVRMENYMDKSTDRNGDKRLTFLFAFYVYSYTFVRIMFLSLSLSLIVMFVRIVISAIPVDVQGEDSSSNKLNKYVNINRIIYKSVMSVADNRAIFEFLHFRHWKAHIVGFGIFLTMVLVQCFTTYGRAMDREMVKKEYNRIVNTSIGVLVAYYVIYTVRLTLAAGNKCAVDNW